MEIGPASVRDGVVRIWASDSLVKQLGMQRAVPPPLKAELSHHGLLYTFLAAPVPGSIEFALQPREPGLQRLALRVADAEEMNAPVLVMP